MRLSSNRPSVCLWSLLALGGFPSSWRANIDLACFGLATRATQVHCSSVFGRTVFGANMLLSRFCFSKFQQSFPRNFSAYSSGQTIAESRLKRQIEQGELKCKHSNWQPKLKLATQSQCSSVCLTQDCQLAASQPDRRSPGRRTGREDAKVACRQKRALANKYKLLLSLCFLNTTTNINSERRSSALAQWPPFCKQTGATA